MSWTQKALDHFLDTPLTAIASHTPDLGSAWVVDTGSARINVDGDQVQVFSGFIRNTTVLADDQAVEMKYSSSGTPPWFGLRYATTGGGQGYAIEVRTGGLGNRLRKFSGGIDPSTGTQLGSTGSTTAIGDVVRIEVVGSNITVFLNGISDITATDTDFTSGATFMYQAGYGDDFAAYEQAAPSIGQIFLPGILLAVRA